MNKEEAETELKKNFDWYEAQADQVARIVFVEHVKPFCRKRGWRFLAGNGAWSLHPLNESGLYAKEDLPDDEEWIALCELLNTEVPGFPGNDLGSIMPDFKDPTCREEP